MAFGGMLAVSDRRYRLKINTKPIEAATEEKDGGEPLAAIG